MSASKALLSSLCLIGLITLAAASTGRMMEVNGNSLGRRLMDISVTASGKSFGLSAFKATGNTNNGNCFLQGYPGSRADSTVAGPLTVDVYPGSTTTVNFLHGSSSHFANYNYSGNTDVTQLQQNATYGLGSVTFKPTTVGQKVNVFSGLIEGSDPVTKPACLVSVNFVTVTAPSAPAPPPPKASGTPSGGSCTGAVPCYCQNGYCFNNGATLTTTCAPPADQSCKPVTVAPSSIGVQYAFGYGNTVNVCQCTAKSG